MFDLTGKSALVTGASGGIGGAIARALHAQGAKVTLAGTRRAALDALAGDLAGTFRLARAALRGMMRRRSGRIIGIASVVGVTGNAGQANYAAAKAGMIGMGKALALEIASRNVTVNCIAPGFVTTAMTDALSEEQRSKAAAAVPVGRFGTPLEVAAAAVFLASDEAAYITGHTLHVNGGIAMV